MSKIRPLMWLTLLGVTLLLALSLTVYQLPAQEARLINADVYVVRVAFDDVYQVVRFAAEKEPWRVDFDAGYFHVDMTQAEIDKFRAQGFHITIDAEQTAAIRRIEAGPTGGDTIPGFPCYRTVEATFASAQGLADAYPNLAQWLDAGDSWEKTQNPDLGYDMMVLRLTNFDLDPTNKPKLFITSAIHAREYTPAELTTRFAEYLIANYGVDADVTWLLDYHDIHLMLQANPDGRKKAETGLLWRKNTNNNYCANTNTRGADLNRNFTYEWGCCGGSSPSPCSETYRGPSAGSEPETQAIMTYIMSIFPDQRGPGLGDPAPENATGIYLDIHSYSELVLWPWGFTTAPAPNGPALQTLGRKLAYFNNYFPEQAIGLYPTDGTTDDFGYGELGIASYVFELGTAFFQSCSQFEEPILPDNLDALIYAAKVVRTPYMTPQGPDVLDPAVSLELVPAGSPVQLTATINDTRFNNQNGTEPTQSIAAAVYSIDTPPWEVGVELWPMDASDGAFNSAIEDVEASVDTTLLTPGRHTLFLQGQDDLGNWGAISAVFLEVFDAEAAPIIQGYVTAAGSGEPLAAAIAANDQFFTETDPATGFYQMQVLSGTYSLRVDPDSPDYGFSTATVAAQDYQTVEQDFTLYPYCVVFNDDVEGGSDDWTRQTPWAVTVERFHSPVHAWSDSPGGNYGNNQDITLTSPALDLSGYDGILLQYWQICDTAAGDYCRVEVSADGGDTWSEVAQFNTTGTAWQLATVEAAPLAQQAATHIRFHFTSNASGVDDGWYIDDIQVLGAGPSCLVVDPPQASFTSSSPDQLGEPTQFSNSSTGDEVTFAWSFGDGSPLNTQQNPSYTYAAVGVYTVTLTATNPAGQSTATGVVEILDGPPQAGFLSSSPDALGATTVFTNTTTGDNLTFVWDFGDGSSGSNDADPTHSYSATGLYTVTLTATNPLGSDVVTGVVHILLPPQASFISSSPDVLGEVTSFINTSTGDDLSFVWDFGDGSLPVLQRDPQHTYAAPGAYTVRLTASNELGSHTYTDEVVIQGQPIVLTIRLFLPLIRH